jgi:hypothetical protein
MIEDLKSGTYILERTRGFFTGRSDKPCSRATRFEPCSGVARFGPADSGDCSTSIRRLDGGYSFPRPLGG